MDIMHFTPAIHKTIAKAATLHRDQTRNFNNVPYIMHPYSVAFILSQYTKDEDVIIAGLLHDTIEDCDYSQEQMKADFGERVAGIVLEVTEDVQLKKAKGAADSWDERKRKYLKGLESASQEALMVSCADKIHNLLSVIEERELGSEAFWRKIQASSARHMRFFGSALEILRKRLDSPIVGEFEKIYARAERLFPRNEE